MLKRLIKTIRQKPKDAKNKIAFSVAVLFTGLITLIWTHNSVLPIGAFTFDENMDASPFSQFFDGIGDIVDDDAESANTEQPTEQLQRDQEARQMLESLFERTESSNAGEEPKEIGEQSLIGGEPSSFFESSSNSDIAEEELAETKIMQQAMPQEVRIVTATSATTTVE